LKAEGAVWPCVETIAADESAINKKAEIERFMSTAQIHFL
jgi:hypothetical protein